MDRITIALHAAVDDDAARVHAQLAAERAAREKAEADLSTFKTQSLAEYLALEERANGLCNDRDAARAECDSLRAYLAESQAALTAARKDSERLDWLERNLLNLSHLRATSSVDMSGNAVKGQLINEARGDGAGPSYFRVWHPTIRAALDAAMKGGK